MQPSHTRQPELGLVYLLFALGAVLAVVLPTLGAPQVPTSWPHPPTLTELEILLRSPSRDQVAGALAILTWAIWLAWGYVFATTAMRVVVIAAERVADGAAWVRSFRTFSDLLTVAPIRRAVDASLTGVLFLRLATSVGAQELVMTPAVAQVQAYDAQLSAAAVADVQPRVSHASDEHATNAYVPDRQPGDIVYVVKPGDTLGALGLHFFGRVDDYQLIYKDNLGRPQPDGRVSTDAGQIRPGWILRVRNPAAVSVETDDEGQRWITVREGDNLSSICGRIFGDENRWPEFFAFNKGARMADGRTLLDPNVIWPGLRLASCPTTCKPHLQTITSRRLSRNRLQPPPRARRWPHRRLPRRHLHLRRRLLDRRL